MPHSCRQTASIVARDRAVAGLALLFDTGALVARLNDAIGTAAVLAAELTYLRYKPGTNCLAKYRLRTPSGPIDVYAKAYGEDAAEKLAKDRQRRTTEGAFGPGRWFFPDSDVVLSTFPNDAKLRYLTHLGDPAMARQQLAGILDTPAIPAAAELQSLAYKPERRYVAKASWPDHSGTAVNYVIKYMSAQEFARVQTTGRCLEAHRVTGVPQLAGASSRRRALAFAWLPGTGLREVTGARDIAYRHLEATGRALAGFHRQTATMQTFPCRDFAARLYGLNEQIGFLLPSLARPMNDLVQGLVAWWRDQNETCGVVHGDFYDKQVVFTEDGVSILDIDSIESGNPVRDLGLFIAHLERDAISGNVDAAKVSTLSDALLRGYVSGSVSGAEPVAIEQLRAYTAFGLVQLAHHPFRSNENHWPEKTEQILMRAAALFERRTK